MRLLLKIVCCLSTIPALAATPLSSPLYVIAGQEPYLIHWTPDQLLFKDKNGPKEVLRKKCNRQSFAMTRKLIQESLTVPAPRAGARPSMRPKALTTYDYEIRDGQQKVFYVAMNSRLGKTLKKFPTQFPFLQVRAEKGCKK